MGSTIVASKTSLEKAIRLAWLDDLNTFGEDSYVYNNDEKLKALFGMKEAINSGLAGQRVFAYGAEKGLHVGNALALINGIGSANWTGLNTVEAVLGSSVAMSAVNANIRAKRLLIGAGAELENGDGSDSGTVDNTNVPYAILDCIETTGTQYIDTGFTPGSNTRFVLDFTYVTDTGIIALAVENNTEFYGFQASNGKWYAFYGNQGAGTSTAISAGTRYVADLNKNALYIDGTLAHTLPEANFECIYTLPIGAQNTNLAISGFANIKIHSAKIYDSNVLVHDFVPVLDNSDVACLYDKVTERLFYNAGSGNFLYGEVVSRPVALYTEVEYLQSGYNSAYFNTGYNPNSNTRVVMDVEIYSDTTDVGGYYFGMYTGDNNDYSVYFDPSERGYISHYFGGNTDVYKEYYDYLYGYRFTIDKTTTKTSITNTAGDEYVVGTYTTSSGNVSGIPMFIMAANGSNGAVEPKNMKFYSMQIYEGSTLVHDYVAAKDSDSTPCIYDKVTGSMLYNVCTTDQFNKGAGVLIAGPEIA